MAWITGSGPIRVGRSIAQHFAERGYRIVLHAYKSLSQAEQFAAELNAMGTETMIVQGAVEAPEFAETSVQRIVREFGRLDVLVNSAAIWDWKSFEETTAQEVQ